MRNTKQSRSTVWVFWLAAGALLVLMISPLSSWFPKHVARENCGISGVVVFPKKDRTEREYKFIRALVRELLISTSLRGGGATGLVVFDKNKKAALFKRRGPASKFVRLPEFQDLVKKIRKDTTFIISHNRAPSVGSPRNNNNNHPVHVDSLYLVHNGHIGNHNRLFEKYKFKRIGEVDTEVIAQLLVHFRKDKITLETVWNAFAELSGGAAVAFGDEKDPHRLFLVVNSATAMSYVTVPDLGLLVFDSGLSYLKTGWDQTVKLFADKDAKPDFRTARFDKQVQFTKFTCVIVDARKGKIETFDLKTRKKRNPEEDPKQERQDEKNSPHERTGDRPQERVLPASVHERR